MANGLLIADAPGLCHLDQLIPPVLWGFCNGDRSLCQQIFDDQIDRLLRLKRPLADLRLGHAAPVIDSVIKKHIHHQQGLHQDPVALGVGIIECELLIPEFTV